MDWWAAASPRARLKLPDINNNRQHSLNIGKCTTHIYRYPATNVVSNWPFLYPGLFFISPADRPMSFWHCAAPWCGVRHRRPRHHYFYPDHLSKAASDMNLNFILEILGTKSYKLVLAKFWIFFFLSKSWGLELWKIPSLHNGPMLYNGNLLTSSPERQ